MSDEHECFEKIKEGYGSTSPFERPIVFEEQTHDMKALAWHAKSNRKKPLYFRIQYCPFCGERLRDSE